jgi:hypothetical protein
MAALSFLVLLSIPTLVYGHGCPSFSFSEDRTLLDSRILPSSFKSFVDEHSSSERFAGVYDCHVERNDYEVAMNAICDESQENCMCEALFQFQTCNSCTICPPQNTTSLARDTGNIGLESFSADCSGVDEAYPNCSVQCGFKTAGCYPPEPQEKEKENSGVQQRNWSVVLVAVSLLLLV